MSKEAMKLALEALEMYLIETNSQFQRSAVTALREALAEQPAQQEPVALEDVYLTIIQWDVGGGKRSRRELARRIVAKYTPPPQRKPLTDEQILAVARDHYNPHQRPEISFARAIEAAHGIKENT